MTISAKALLLTIVVLALIPSHSYSTSLDLSVRKRNTLGIPFDVTQTIDPTKTAIVVIDMWNSHADSGWLYGAEALIPRMNQTFDVARQLGMQIVFAPSDALSFYNSDPRRLAVTALPNVAKPNVGITISGSPPYGTDVIGNRTEHIPPGVTVPALPVHNRQHPDLVIKNAASDWIINGDNNQELWNIMAAKGITNLIYTGVATNWCVWTRDSAVFETARELNVQPLLLRDLTYAYSSNGKNPDSNVTDFSWSAERGTRESIAWYERNVFGSINAAQILEQDASQSYAYSDRIASESGLLSYWRMDGKNGCKQLQDIAQTQDVWNAENALLGVTGAIVGDADTAAKFNGTAGLIVAPRYQANLPTDTPAGNSPLVSLSDGSFSVEAWVQVDSLSGGNQWVFSHDAGPNNTVDFLLGINSAGKFEFATRQNKANNLLSAMEVTPADVSSNRWFHVVGVQDVAEGKLQLYVNGQLASQQVGVSGVAPNVQSSLQIGSRGATAVASNGSVTSSGTEFFNGAIDELAIYGRALSATDVQAHYMLGTNPAPTERLTLQVDRFTGAATLYSSDQNTTNVQLVSYTLNSPSNPLSSTDTRWKSFQDAGKLGWFEANPTTANLSELASAAPLVMAPGTIHDFLTPFVPNSNAPLGTDRVNVGAASFKYQLLDGSLVNADIVPVGRFNDLVLVVDPTTGFATLQNQSQQAIEFIGYTISSPSGTLRPSYAGSGQPGWFVANPTTKNLSELASASPIILSEGEFVSLGTAWDTSGLQDLSFKYQSIGGTLISGTIAFGALASIVSGDYNLDGTVDAADYVLWRKKPTDYGGLVGYHTWRQNFGSSFGGGTSAHAGGPVPEPATIVLIGFAIALLTAMRTSPFT